MINDAFVSIPNTLHTAVVVIWIGGQGDKHQTFALTLYTLLSRRRPSECTHRCEIDLLGYFRSTFFVDRHVLASALIFLWTGLGMDFANSAIQTPQLSVGAGLGNRAPRLWHKTCFRSFRLG